MNIARIDDASQIRDKAMSEADRLARDHLRLFAAGDEAGMLTNVSPDYFNHRSADEPLAARDRGPAAVVATMRWIHRAFADMRFEFHDVVVRESLVALNVTLHARQHGPFVVHDSPDARVTDVFPSRGRSFAARQTHWITVANGAVSEHDAVRDDLGMAKQLGWLPPSPVYVARMLFALVRERRASGI
jgi:ketosteroid isomerase-like protein